MKRLKGIVLSTTVGLIVSGSGAIAGQPTLINAGIGIATIGAMLSKHNELLGEVNTLTTALGELQLATVQNHGKVNQQIGKLTLNINEQSQKLEKQTIELRTHSTRQRSVLSNLDKIQHKQKRLDLTLANHEKQLLSFKTQPSLPPMRKKETVVAITSSQGSIPVKRVYIDGNNLKYAAEALDIQIDFKSLKIAIAELGSQTDHQLDFNYYIGSSPHKNYGQERSLKRLDQLGYNVTALPVIVQENKTMKTVGDDIAIATDMMKNVKKGDEVILVSGDGDFLPVVQAIQQRGAKVILVSKKGMVNSQLRQECNEFIALEDLAIAQLTKLRIA
ncbi:MAG: NYN domain-containing protein [Snowella sp.]|nr:NYN domain-containing protein [Snowella sp.]